MTSSERYLPPSDFLRAVIAGNAPLSGSEFGDANFRLLIVIIDNDDDRANRDWATLLLAQQDIDTPEVREVLVRAASDEHDAVRAEAILGLAQRDPAAALPLLQKALAMDSVVATIFEAAALVAHPSLVEDLRCFTEPSDNGYADAFAVKALAACEGSAR
jgi:HEAT repeat protein